MDRAEWGEIVGDQGEVMDDLRWSLFSAERCAQAMWDESEGSVPSSRLPVYNAFKRQVRDCRFALAALWARRYADEI